jgi:radical SAM superfamily enzyme YgiQ (UPF0313 family)
MRNTSFSLLARVANIGNLNAMPDIVLSTLNAKFIHAAFGLRYLFANLGELQPRAVIAEFDINQRPLDIAEKLLAYHPRIIGLGVYIWNVAETTEVVATIKRVRPDIKIILGGPEVSFETEQQEIVRLADHVITGEADLKFAEMCRVLLNQHVGDEVTSLKLKEKKQNETPHVVSYPRIIAAELPDFSRINLPYDFYTDADIAHRVVYVEASRGCPFSCEFCLSSLDIPVRAAPLEIFFGEMQKLLDRGLKQFKFVDRTFNLNIATGKAILEFFLARHLPGNFYHFEMIPDRLPAELREIIARFPPGSLQFEVGIQTFNPEVGQNISRRQNYERMADNFDFLRKETGVHIHADLIVGLPGETVESFAAGFDRLIALGPQEIQVGILKRLRGTPIIRHDAEWKMVYNAQPPYEILQNKLIDFATMQRLRRFAKYWDLVGNSGNFIETTPLIWSAGRVSSRAENDAALAPCADSSKPRARHSTAERPAQPSPFDNFLRFSDWLYARIGRTDTIALTRLAELLFEFLTKEQRLDKQTTTETLSRDWCRGRRRDAPEFLREFFAAENAPRSHAVKTPLPKRQARHLAGN